MALVADLGDPLLLIVQGAVEDGVRPVAQPGQAVAGHGHRGAPWTREAGSAVVGHGETVEPLALDRDDQFRAPELAARRPQDTGAGEDRKSTRLNSSH